MLCLTTAPLHKNQNQTLRSFYAQNKHVFLVAILLRREIYLKLHKNDIYSNGKSQTQQLICLVILR